MNYIRLCPPPPTIWQIRQEMIDLYKEYQSANELTEKLRKQWKMKKKLYEDMSIESFVAENGVTKHHTPTPPKEVKLSMDQIRAIAKKLGVSIDF